MIKRAFACAAFSALLSISFSALAADPAVFGWVEMVRIRPGNLEMSAKLDTGAERSSINARGLQMFQQDGKTWARFALTNEGGRTRDYERLVVDHATIRRANTEKQRRHVILLGICLGNIFREVEVTLADRSGMDQDLLIGRNFLADHALVDSGRRLTTQPNCPSAT